MHVAFLTPEYPTPQRPHGGLANYIRKVGRQLVGRGHEVSVLVLAESDGERSDAGVRIVEVSRDRLDGDLRTGRAGLGHTWRAGLWPLGRLASSHRMARALWALHRRQPVDILQTSTWAAPGYALVGNGRVPVVCRLSSLQSLLREGTDATHDVRQYASEWFETWQVLAAEGVFSPSELLADYLLRREGIEARVIRTPFPDPPASRDASFYEDNLAGMDYLLYVGNINATKGADLLADALPPVFRQHNELRCVLIGPDYAMPGDRRGTIVEHIRRSCQDFADHVLHFPPVEKDKLWPVMENALALLMPSRMDNYPNACLEAQMLGVPVVGTYESSLDEMITDGRTGFLARNGDAGDLAVAMRRLLQLSPDQKAQMRRQILQSVEEARGRDRVGQLVGFYEETIAGFSPRPEGARTELMELRRSREDKLWLMQYVGDFVCERVRDIERLEEEVARLKQLHSQTRRELLGEISRLRPYEESYNRIINKPAVRAYRHLKGFLRRLVGSGSEGGDGQ
ncbi:MAG: glycosyltransferase family 4 protein [Candidatus Brocadiia bacterium]